MNKQNEREQRTSRQKAVTEPLQDLENKTAFYLGLLRNATHESERQAQRDNLQRQVDSLGYCYQETGNPLFCWRALLVCRDAGLSMPEWIMTYLYNAGLEIVNKSYQGNPKPHDVKSNKKPKPLDVKLMLYKALAFDIEGKGGAPGQFKTVLQQMAGLDTVLSHEISGTRKIKAEQRAAAALLTDTGKKVDEAVHLYRTKWDKRADKWRQIRRKPAEVEAARRALIRIHGRALPDRAIKALEDGRDLDIDENGNSVLRTVAGYLRKYRVKLKKIK
jgi:hypothetical protein